MPHSALIQSLLQADVYPDSVSSVQLVETHISWVLLTGDYVYKIKKPVNFGFLDFSNLQLRRHFCEEELRLNRRLAPRLYLEVIAIRGTPEKPALGGMTPAIEYALKMRQFDPEATFDHLALKGRLKGSHIDRLAETVATFHKSLSAKKNVDADRMAQEIHARALRNFSTIDPFAKSDQAHDVLQRLREWTQHAFDECAPVIRKRVEKGFVRECHGDLHLGNIALIDEQPVPFDCIEFNEEMRWIDLIDEVAFTVMDLHAHNLPEYANRFLNRYLQITGDYQALTLLTYYWVYRAVVRAKVALLSRDPSRADPLQVRVLENKYHHYISNAETSITKPKPLLLITHGLSGCGKSTIAARIAETLPAIQLRSDVERKRLAQSNNNLQNKLYSDEVTRITYHSLAETARILLESGYSVIVDATFLQKTWRELFRNRAQNYGVRFRILDIQAPVKVLKERITRRLLEQKDPSDADIEVLELQQKHRDRLTPSERETAISILSTGETDIRDLIEQLNN